MNIPFVFQAASLLAAFTRPSHLVNPSSRGYALVPSRSNLKSFGYKRPCISPQDRLYSLSFFFTYPLYRAALLALLLALASISRPGYSAHYHDDVEAFPPWKEGRELGELNMPVSSDNEQARLHFQTGVKLVHLYEFPQAMWSFKKAQELDPTFAMAYWGEMMANQMLVWYAKEPEQAIRAYERMKKLADVENLTALEKGLIEAARVLFQDSRGIPPYDRNSSVWGFRKNMAELMQRFPSNPDVKVFYGYSVLGTRRGVRDFKTNRQAATLFIEVLQAHPKHPGALHYLLHATENPVQSYLGRQSAETMAGIASASIHALHMPSHHYFALGDWQKVVDINRKAWEGSRERARDLKLSEDTLEYHGYGWVIYGLLQQGRHREAYQALKDLYQLYEKSPSTTKLKYLLFARAGFLVDSPPDSRERRRVRETRLSFESALTASMAASIYATAYDAWQSGDRQRVMGALNQYQEAISKGVDGLAPPDRDAVKIMHHLTLGLGRLVQDGDFLAADDHLSKARIMEMDMVHEHGIPLVVKPAVEMYAEFLKVQGKERYREAEYFYKMALKFQPGRKVALEGLEEVRGAQGM